MAQPRSKPVQLESAEQKAFVQWCDLESHPWLPGHIGDYLFSIPNGASKLPIKLAMKLKLEGLRSGIPDLMLACPMIQHGFAGLFIEMKKQRQHFLGIAEQNRAVNANQTLWGNRLGQVGYICKVAYGFDEARKITLEYLAHGR